MVGDRLHPADAPVLRADDRGFLYGDGIFETIRVLDGRPQHRDRHLDRLRTGLAELRIGPLGDPPLAERIDTLLTATGASRGEFALRISVSRGAGNGPRPRGLAPTVILSARPLGAAFLRRRAGVRLRTVHGTARTLAHLKSLAYLPSVLALGSVAADEEPLFVDDDGAALEGATCNIFARFGDALLTPENGVLPGIARGLLLERAAMVGLRARAERLTLDDLSRADGLWVSNALLPLAPVIALDDAVRAPDPQTAALRDALLDAVAAETGR